MGSEDTIYVAVGGVEESELTLLWVLHNLKPRKVCILHVHQPSKMISSMYGVDGNLAEIIFDQQQIRGLEEVGKDMMNRILDEYLLFCSQAGVSAIRLHIQMDDAAKGIVELIRRHNIKKLVMGAAADEHFSEGMWLMSKKAQYVNENAPFSCQIWFICREHLVHTRFETGQSSNAPSPSGSSYLTSSTEAAGFGSTVSEEREESECEIELYDLLHSGEEGSSNDQLFDRLEQALKEAESSNQKAFEESDRRVKAEMNATRAMRQAKMLERLYNECKRENETALAKQNESLENIKRLREELSVSREQNSILESRVANSERRMKQLEDELSSAVEQLQVSLKERDELQIELENSHKVIEELLRKQAEETSSTHMDQFNLDQLSVSEIHDATLDQLEICQKEKDELQVELENTRRINEELLRKLSEDTSNSHLQQPFIEFSLSEIEEATEDFDQLYKIAEGARGSVYYKCALRHTEVVIKVLGRNSFQDSNEFLQEVDDLIKLRHPNLVNLIGACPEKRALVYEYVPNGSLEDHLNRRNDMPPLSWQSRMHIATQLCSTLMFLHSGKLVHGNLKPGNILLDYNFGCKLSDFGSCRASSLVENSSNMTESSNPNPYLDPEFRNSRRVSHNLDLYPFGIIVLQLPRGRKISKKEPISKFLRKYGRYLKFSASSDALQATGFTSTMSLSGSLQLSYDLGLCRIQVYKTKFKIVLGRGKLDLLSSDLSSRASFLQQHEQDVWRSSLSNKLYRPMHFVPYRNNAFRCHAFGVPAQILELPGVKAASIASTRSYNTLQASPLALKLIPAATVIIFALYGVGPLIRQGRSLLLHKSDNSWKKSRTHYVTTSYVQPLLLWAGAILMCRTLDPLVLSTEASQVVKQRLLNFVRSLSTVLAFAFCLSSTIQQMQKFFMDTSDSSDTRNMGFQFAGKAIYSAVWVAAVSLFMELLGFSTEKWLTAGGLGTVLLTLAGREIFTNFLSSAMIHATRPFVVNEWIQTKIEGYEVSGTVEHVGWWSPTILRGEDREAVHIPNHKFTVNVVRNLSQKTHWRIKTHLAISHMDVHKISNIVADMRKVLAKNPQVEQQRLHRRVFLENINPENQALMILVSCFVKTSHFEEYLCVKEAILLDLLRVTSHHHARLATPIRTVQKVYSDADLENIPFADSMYNHDGVQSNRPLLLIEPSYKINGEDRTKGRSSRPAREQDGKTTVRPSADTKGDNKAGMIPKPDSKSKGTPSVEPKADAKIGETPSSDTKENFKATFEPTSDDKVLLKSPSKSVSKTNSKAAETSSFSPKVPDSISDNLLKNKKVTDKQQKNARQSSESENPSLTLQETGIDKAGGLREPFQSKQEDEKLPVSQPPMTRSALEENIVLGVALEGSKRTLPIDEGLTSSAVDAKEVASSSRNGNGSTAGDKKEGQILSTSKTPNNQ